MRSGCGKGRIFFLEKWFIRYKAARAPAHLAQYSETRLCSALSRVANPASLPFRRRMPAQTTDSLRTPAAGERSPCTAHGRGVRWACAAGRYLDEGAAEDGGELVEVECRNGEQHREDVEQRLLRGRADVVPVQCTVDELRGEGVMRRRRKGAWDAGGTERDEGLRILRRHGAAGRSTRCARGCPRP